MRIRTREYDGRLAKIAHSLILQMLTGLNRSILPTHYLIHNTPTNLITHPQNSTAEPHRSLLLLAREQIMRLLVR